MKRDDLEKLKQQLREEVAAHPAATRVALVGRTAEAFELQAELVGLAPHVDFLGIFDLVRDPDPALAIAMRGSDPDIVVVADDDGKEALLEAAAAAVGPRVRLLVGGFGHFAFRDERFRRITRDTFIPSLANGYPNSLIHIFQCLENAAKAGLEGVVAEFGMFKGGTTMLISRFIEELGKDWKVIGFDTFDGFPSRRSALDMYDHPDCVYLDQGLVERVFAGRNVEIVAGDVVSTVQRLADERLVLSFVDTDNYTSARAIIDVIADRTEIGGAIVFDHWTGRDRFLYTIGERLAAKPLAADPRYLNLHDTGVFLRMR